MRDNAGRDLLSDRWFELAIYWLPVAAIVASGIARVDAFWRTGIWSVALATMGLGCLANALRCGRTHCYFTGPFFLLMATVTLLYGLGIISLGRFGWNIISVGTLLGAIILCWLPESVLGRYRKDA